MVTQSPTPPLLEARDLGYAYPGGVPALSGLNLALRPGRRLAILGSNGAGKTTLLLHLNGTLQPSAGTVLLNDVQAKYTKAALTDWRRQVGLVLQEADDQLFAATVFEDVSFGPMNLDLPEAEVRQRVDSALAALRIGDLGQRPTHMLSFGQKKRVAIAGAVAMRPRALLLDEPTAGLDHHGSVHLLSVLEKLNHEGTTLAFTTHDVDLAYAFADEIALFDKGKVVAQGDPVTLLSDAALLSQCRLKAPLVLELGLKARQLGLLGAGEALPRRGRDMLSLMDRLAG